MVIIWPEIEISGRKMASGHILQHFFRPKNFWQNGGNFGPPATSEVKNLLKIFKFFWFTQNIRGHNMAGNRNFWPILSSAEKIYVIMLVIIILTQKTYFSILYVTGTEKVEKIITKIHEIWLKIANFAQFWRIFDILWPERGRSIIHCIYEDIWV